jgi:hypothetical protein
VNVVTLQNAMRARPFRPFQLVSADGSRVAVNHPEWIAFAGGRVAVVTSPDDSVAHVDVMRVTRVDLGPPVTVGPIAPNPNGGE